MVELDNCGILKSLRLLLKQDMNEFPLIPPLPSYGRGRDAPGGRYASLITGSNLTDVIITGTLFIPIRVALVKMMQEKILMWVNNMVH